MECFVCLQRFETEGALQEHIKSRVQHLFDELRQYLTNYTIFNIPPTQSQALGDNRIPPDERRKSSESYKSTRRKRTDGPRAQACPHFECVNKPRTLFDKHSNLVRHYTMHVDCDEKCPFCGFKITRVRAYVTHLDKCQKKQESREAVFPEQLSTSISQRRQTLIQAASAELDEELSVTEHSNGEGDSSGSRCDTGREAKRQQKVSLEMSGPRKRQITEHSFRADGVVGGSSHTAAEDAATCPDGTRSTSSSTRSMPSNREHEVVPSGDPEHRLPTSNAASLMLDFENGRLASAPGLTGCSAELQFEKLSPMRAPFASSYTIDEPLDREGHICSQDGEPLLPRAPFSSSFTMDQPLQQDPLTSYTMDGQFSNLGQYNVQTTGW